MTYKTARISIIVRNFCIALLCISLVGVMVFVSIKSQPRRGFLQNPEEIRNFLAEELGGDFAEKPHDWLMDFRFTSRDETIDYEIHRYSGRDSLGIRVRVEIWVINGEVQYYYERDDVLDTLISSL